MTPHVSAYYADESVTVYHGDCLDVLRELPDANVDAVVCDPPYGLANTTPEQVADTILRWLNGDRDYVPAGAGFMGASWDAFVPPVAVWDECLRVLKPGGHLLAFAGTRTQDLMALGIRLAGFEVRDSIAWLYASGFPKSLDVSKAIDKANGRKFEDRFALGRHIRERREAAGLSRAEINCYLGAVTKAEHYESDSPGFARVPSLADWHILRERLGLSDEYLSLVERAEAEREVIGKHPAPASPRNGTFNASFGEALLTAPATPDAEKWQGWGTALKPAFEPIVVARKPLTGTVAQNVLAHGTGALNVDGCRVAYQSDTDKASARPQGAATSRVGALAGKAQTCDETPGLTEPFTTAPTRASSANSATTGHASTATPAPRTTFTPTEAAGRWPTNVVLDDTAAAELDRQAPDTGGAGKASGPTLTGESSSVARGRFNGVADTPFYGDSGGASRFFPTFRYEAKAPTEERPRVNGVAHATVKPLDLMRWLVRLVTPPGGTVLDPFAGSGTTAEACVIEGFPCITIEREADYLPLILARLTKPIEPVLDLGALA